MVQSDLYFMRAHLTATQKTAWGAVVIKASAGRLTAMRQAEGEAARAGLGVPGGCILDPFKVETTEFDDELGPGKKERCQG